jgi:hypothetical protein
MEREARLGRAAAVLAGSAVLGLIGASCSTAEEGDSMARAMASARTTEEWYLAHLESITDISNSLEQVRQLIQLDAGATGVLSDDGRALVGEACSILGGFAQVSGSYPPVPEVDDQRRWAAALDAWREGAVICIDATETGDGQRLADALERMNEGSASLLAMEVG